MNPQTAFKWQVIKYIWTILRLETHPRRWPIDPRPPEPNAYTNHFYLLLGYAPIRGTTPFWVGAGIHIRTPRLLPKYPKSSIFEPFWGQGAIPETCPLTSEICKANDPRPSPNFEVLEPRRTSRLPDRSQNPWNGLYRSLIMFAWTI